VADYSERTPNFDLFGLGFLSQRFNDSADGDTGASFPRSDVEDLGRGVRFIPGEVTMARRAGRKVTLFDYCSANCWYWEFDDGSRTYHFDPLVYDRLKGDGKCLKCGNEHIAGGRVPASPPEPGA
jgi:hypothetical protein